MYDNHRHHHRHIIIVIIIVIIVVTIITNIIIIKRLLTTGRKAVKDRCNNYEGQVCRLSATGVVTFKETDVW